jgi:hypothetical protein
MKKNYTLMTAEFEELKDTAFNLTISEDQIEVSLSFPYYLSFSTDTLRYSDEETIQTMLKILEQKIKKGGIENGKG